MGNEPSRQVPNFQLPIASYPEKEDPSNSHVQGDEREKLRDDSEQLKSDDPLDKLKEELQGLSPMDKRTMSGPCSEQTDLMEDFMHNQVGMKNTDDYFVQGVRAFYIKKALAERDPEEDVILVDTTNGTKFRMKVREILQWQKSYRVFVAKDIYSEDEKGRNEIKEALSGHSADGEEAWKVKFCIRISQNPIFMYFDGIVFEREADEPSASNIYLVSVCGMDFAGRQHDVDDIRKYVTNWREVYHLIAGELVAPFGGRDFFPTGKPAILDKPRLFKDLKKMARLRLRAQDLLGIQVCGEVGLGLGVFSGDGIGIGEDTRTLSVQALREVLEEETFQNIQVVLCAMPVFRRKDNYHYFVEGFKGYKGKTPVWILDQDMHKIARTAARLGFKTSELNPADSHGVFGEYWQNRGPGTEEKLALTTAGLLTQHHAVNPEVLNTDNYVFLDVEDAPTEKEGH